MNNTFYVIANTVAASLAVLALYVYGSKYELMLQIHEFQTANQLIIDAIRRDEENITFTVDGQPRVYELVAKCGNPPDCSIFYK